ncbi:MAG: transcriptional repressor [Clostridia bacterium]|nr:transcriptional repressor [Clostridia bacterium]
MQRYSRQREMIFEYLKNTTAHPTAETVYNDLKAQSPQLSLATVYRNLNLLVEMGKAVKLDTGENVDRFDANTDNHYHFVCTCCHKVSDIFDGILSVKSIEDIVGDGFSVEGHKLFIYGKCACCNKKS